MYTVVDGVLRLGRFDPVPCTNDAGPRRPQRRVHIPADTVAEFSLDVLPRLVDVAPVEIEEGLFTPPTISGPIPVLTVKLGADGVRAYWSTATRSTTAPRLRPRSGAARTGLPRRRRRGPRLDAVVPALRVVAAASRTWRQQALGHLQTAMKRLATCRAARRAGGDRRSPTDAAGAAAVASMATLRSGVDLTPGRGRGAARRGPAATGLPRRLRDRVGPGRARIPCPPRPVRSWSSAAATGSRCATTGST